MKSTRVYDWPTRIFHWLFAGCFIAAFFIAKTFDDESATYPIHMLLGLVMVALVGLRLIWGLMGSQYARLGSLQLHPKKLFMYFKNLLSGRGERTLGHNPASSWAAILMMALALGLGVTGYLMTSGSNKEALEDVHELLANAFIVVVIAHVSGIILHTMIHRDNIALSMIHGSKKTVAQENGISRTYWGVGVLFLALIGGFVFHLNKNYDATRQSLNFFGTTLRLGETEEEQRKGSSDHQERDERKDGDKDSDEDGDEDYDKD